MSKQKQTGNDDKKIKNIFHDHNYGLKLKLFLYNEHVQNVDCVHFTTSPNHRGSNCGLPPSSVHQ